MDVVLHPRFTENRWVYFTYHTPEGRGAAVTLARGTWSGLRSPTLATCSSLTPRRPKRRASRSRPTGYAVLDAVQLV
jgi:hypothetical protein